MPFLHGEVCPEALGSGAIAHDLALWASVRSLQTKRSAEPRPLLEPRPRGTNEQHPAGALLGALVPSTAS